MAEKGRRHVGASVAVLLLVCLFITLVFVSPSHAVPQFAKKYERSCETCHSAVPKLNAFGERFRANGYQLPGTIDQTPIWQQTQLPLSGMPHSMWMLRRVENNMKIPTPNGIAAGKTFEVNTWRGAFEFFSGGTVGPHLTYLMFMEIELEPEVEGEVHYAEMPPEVEVPATIGTATDIKFHKLFFMYNNVVNVWGENIGNLNLRFGVFHLDVPFNPLRKLTSEMSPYLVYDIAPVQGGFRLGVAQMGASALGWLGSMRFGLEYEAAILNGNNSGIDTNPDKDFFGRLAFRWLERLRLGGMYYGGTQNIAQPGGGGGHGKLQAGIDVEGGREDKFRRWGLDFDLMLPRNLSIFGQWMYGKDDDIDAGFHGQQALEWDGLFVEGDIPLTIFDSQSKFLKRWWLIGRYDEISTRSQWRHPDAGAEMMIRNNTGDQDRIRQYVIAMRHYFQPNVFLVLEYGWKDNMLGYPALDQMFGGEGSGRAGRIVDVDSRWGMVMAVLAF